MSGQSQSSLTLIRRLAARLARPVEAGMRARAALHVLDWAGCAMAGAPSAAGQAMAAALEDEGEGKCTLVGAGRRASPLTAAMLNGALGNVLEMDDVDKRAILHPGPSVIPAALAAAEGSGAESAAFLDAVVRGYEAVIALGRAVGPGHYAFWHNTGTCGPFGAAAAAASVLNLDELRTAHALGLAATQASGFWQTRHEPASMAKQLHTARAAHAGLAAAQLSAQGFDGPLAILEGPQGFFAATCPGADPEAVMADHGAPWLIEQVSFKPWPACRHAHAAIDAALAARAAGISPDQISAAELVTYADAIKFCDRPQPASVIEAKFSLQHALAVTLLRGEPQLADFEADAFNDPQVKALARRVSARAGDPYLAAYPARYGAGLRLTLTGGAVRAFDHPDALGDPENPLSPDQLAAKARRLARHGGFGADAADALVSAALGLATGGSLAAFSAALGASTRSGAAP
jgi:2-methylcitrate dehydratase PrpD